MFAMGTIIVFLILFVVIAISINFHNHNEKEQISEMAHMALKGDKYALAYQEATKDYEQACIEYEDALAYQQRFCLNFNHEDYHRMNSAKSRMNNCHRWLMKFDLNYYAEQREWREAQKQYTEFIQGRH